MACPAPFLSRRNRKDVTMNCGLVGRIVLMVFMWPNWQVFHVVSFGARMNCLANLRAARFPSDGLLWRVPVTHPTHPMRRFHCLVNLRRVRHPIRHLSCYEV